MEEVKIGLTINQAKFIKNMLKAVVDHAGEFGIYESTIIQMSSIVQKIEEELLKK